MSIRTSQTHPLRIDELPVPGTGAVLGLTFCPGKHQPHAHTGRWERDLDADLAVIAAWGASLILNLMEAHELRALRVADTPSRLPRGVEWMQLPIPDGGVPDPAWEDTWIRLAPALHQRLDAGERIVLHCKGGLGRTGLVAARLLIERGLDARRAVRDVRAVRQGAIENAEQERYVLALRGPSE